MRPATFTSLMVRYLMDDPTTPAVVLHALKVEPDADRREVALAVGLRDAIVAALKIVNADETPDGRLTQTLIEMAAERTNWRQVARALLRHYSLPVIVATPPGRSSDRIAWSPACWKGNVN